MINCGGNVSLPDMLKQFKNQKTKLVLLDSHRPLHHDNISQQNGNIIVIDDGHIDWNNCPQQQDFAVLDEEEDLEENLLEFENKQEKEEDKDAEILEKVRNFEKQQKEDEGDVEDDKYEQDQDKAKSEDGQSVIKDNEQQQENENSVKNGDQASDIVTEKEQSIFEVEDDNKEDNFEAVIGQKQMQRKFQRKEQRQRMKDMAQKKIDSYYSGSYCGTEISGIMYKMCQIMNKKIPDFLWYWILGLTDQCQSYRINKNIYQKRASQIDTEVLKMNLDTKPGSLMSKNYQKIGTISIDQKLDLVLLPYWNLYDCLVYSNNTIPKLKTWHEAGKNQIQELIVKLGIPLTEAKQQFKYLKPQYKQDLEVKFGSISNYFDFDDILTSMFVRIFDNQHQYTSFDFAFMCNNILNCPFNFQDMVNTHIENFDYQKEELEHGNLQNNFWLVYHEILNLQNQYIKKAINYSINYQTKIVDIAFQLLKQKKIKTCSNFYYVIMNEQDFESNIILSYLSLEKIANLLINIKLEILKILIKQQKKNIQPRAKAMVLCLFSKQNNSYFVLGSNGIDNSSSSSSIKKNSFGNRFKNAAEKVKARYSCDSFEASLIQIYKNDFDNFLEALVNQIKFIIVTFFQQINQVLFSFVSSRKFINLLNLF